MSEALIQPVTTFRVWSDGQDHDRLALASRGSERVLIEDGTTLWRNESFLLRKIGRRLACGAREDRPGGARMATLDFELEIGSGAAGIYPVVARALAFSPDRRRLATASDDMTARIWVLSDDE